MAAEIDIEYVLWGKISFHVICLLVTPQHLINSATVRN